MGLVLMDGVGVLRVLFIDLNESFFSSDGVFLLASLMGFGM